MRRCLLLLLLLATPLTIGACSDGSPDAVSHPPILTEVSLHQTEMPVNQDVRLTAEISFYDEDGDLSRVAFTTRPVRREGVVHGEEIPGVPVSVREARGVTSGKLTFGTTAIASTAGTYEFEFYLVDKAGNESERSIVTIEAK